MKKIFFVAIISVFLLSCAKKQDVSACTQGTHEYGFFGGLWHGIIAPFDFIAMLFNDNVTVYATNNNGGWYALGFVLGAGILFGGTSSATDSKK